jgi:hypothetical protein
VRLNTDLYQKAVRFSLIPFPQVMALPSKMYGEKNHTYEPGGKIQAMYTG